MRRETAAPSGGGYLVADPAETNPSGESRLDRVNRSEHARAAPPNVRPRSCCRGARVAGALSGRGRRKFQDCSFKNMATY